MPAAKIDVGVLSALLVCALLLVRWSSPSLDEVPIVAALLVAALVIGVGSRRLEGDRLGGERIAAAASWAMVALGLGYLLHCVWHAWSFTTDDAYITLRYARNLVEGFGVRFNPGESPPVEGYSNFPYLLIGAASLLVGADPILVLKIVSVVAALASLSILFFLLRPLCGGILSAFAVLYLGMYRGMAWWTVSGLESAWFQLTVVGAIACVLPILGSSTPRRHDRRRLFLGGAIASLAAVTRPEGALIGITLFACLVAHELLRLRQRGTSGLGAVFARLRWFAIAFGAPFALYLGWRLSYFGRLFPNTVYCKSSAPFADPWVLSGELFRANRMVAWLALLALVRVRDRRLWPLVLLPLGYVAMLHGVDPIIGRYTRHFLGVLPLLVGLAMIGVSVAMRWLGGMRFGGASTVALLAGLVGLGLMLPRSKVVQMEAEAARYTERMAIRERLAEDLDRAASRPDAWVMLGDSGIIPYESRLRFLDAYCLNSREMTTAPILRDPKRFSSFVLEDARPEFIVVHGEAGEELVPHGYLGVWPALLGEPAFQADYQLRWRTHGDRYGTYWVMQRRELAGRKPGQAPPTPQAAEVR